MSNLRAWGCITFLIQLDRTKGSSLLTCLFSSVGGCMHGAWMTRFLIAGTFFSCSSGRHTLSRTRCLRNSRNDASYVVWFCYRQIMRLPHYMCNVRFIRNDCCILSFVIPSLSVFACYRVVQFWTTCGWLSPNGSGKQLGGLFSGNDLCLMLTFFQNKA